MRTKVRIVSEDFTDSRVIAHAEVTLDDDFVIHDIKVIRGRDGLFVAMPSRLGSDGVYRDVAHPINRRAREQLDSAVMRELARVRNR